jgi:RNA polymerase sigma factor (TIGR02999 family)
MTTPTEAEFANLLHRAKSGRPGALDELVARIYHDVRRMAAQRMRRERSGHTLQTTALVHEAFLRVLSDGTLDKTTDRSFLYRAVGMAMSRVLIDHARKRNLKKGPAHLNRSPLDAAIDRLTSVEDVSVGELREGLEELNRVNSRAFMVLQLRYFHGMNRDDVAKKLGLSQKTVERDWRFARGWLFERLNPEDVP